METNKLMRDKFRQSPCRRLASRAFLAAGWLLLPGCGVFSSSFLSTLDPTGTGLGATTDLPPGFVVVTFANNARVDEQLLNFLESSAGGGLQLTDAEKIALRPRIRLTVRITFAGGTSLDVEFIDGSSELVEPRFLSQSATDLNQNELSNIVSVCEVRSVTLRPGSPIEVFIPVEMRQLELVEVAGPGGQTIPDFQVRALISPRFRNVETDVIGTDGQLIRRNIGIEDLPSPTQNPLCGSFIGITLDGFLSVPFNDNGGGFPSFDQDDPVEIGTIGGRFEFRVTIG